MIAFFSAMYLKFKKITHWLLLGGAYILPHNALIRLVNYARPRTHGIQEEFVGRYQLRCCMPGSISRLHFIV